MSSNTKILKSQMYIRPGILTGKARFFTLAFPPTLTDGSNGAFP